VKGYGTAAGNDSFFKERADDGNFYILRRDGSTPEETWTLESFREILGDGISRVHDAT